jgi:hypothetical protein
MKKPALGIKPTEIWLSDFEGYSEVPYLEALKRYVELTETIKRRIDNGDSLDVEWIKEYNVHLELLPTYEWFK